MKGALNPELVDGLGSQDSGLPPREHSSALPTPFTGPSIVGTEQLRQEANGDTLLEAHTQPLSTTSKRYLMTAGLLRRNGSLPLTANQNSERGRRLQSGKRRKWVLRPRRSRSRGSADEDDEYEVEQILEARVYRRKLQYRVKWLGYEDDPAWYDASNFKNSPRKLREFHTANPIRPGPPERLEVWLRCWEEDRDADDHSDDNKPQRLHTGRGTLRIPEPCGYSLRRYSRVPVSAVQP
jgi:hypothetical protein